MTGTQAATQFPQDGIPETGPDALVPVFVKIVQSGGGGFLEDVAARSCRADEVPSAAAPPSGFVQRVRIEYRRSPSIKICSKAERYERAFDYAFHSPLFS
jgi:hypothetical protein